MEEGLPKMSDQPRLGGVGLEGVDEKEKVEERVPTLKTELKTGLKYQPDDALEPPGLFVGESPLRDDTLEPMEEMDEEDSRDEQFRIEELNIQQPDLVEEPEEDVREALVVCIENENVNNVLRLEEEQVKELGDGFEVNLDESDNEDGAAQKEVQQGSSTGGKRRSKEKLDPNSRCPPPAPQKIRGGRRTLLKKTMETEVPEDEVQKACSVFKNRKTLRPEVEENETGLKAALLPFQSPMGPLMRQHQIQKDYIEFLKTMFSPNPRISIALMQHCRKSKGLKNQIYFEHLNFIWRITCKEEGKDVDPKEWLIEFSKVAKTLFYNHLPHYTFESFGLMLQNVCYRATEKISTMKLRYLDSQDALSNTINKLNKIISVKARLGEELDDLHLNLSKTEPKFDEMSITGIRLVKLILFPPYVKTEDGGLTPMLLTPEQVVRNQDFYFRWGKQKWTTKDLTALKQCIKEAIIAKNTDLLEARYRELMDSSTQKREMELAEEGRRRESLNLPPVKRKRGRPTREEVQQRDKYGVIYTTVAALPNQATASLKVTPKLLSNWRTAKERRWKAMGFEALMKEDKGNIDWKDVAQKMMMKTRKLRSPADCKLAWEHEVNPDVNTKRWTAEETRLLKENVEIHDHDWTEVARAVNQRNIEAEKPTRTPYLCFFRYRNRIAPPARLEWTGDLDNQVKGLLEEHPAQWRRIAASMENEAATKRAVVERYKKSINPMLRTGAFTRVEDALLLLTIERLKPFLAREGHFGSLLAYLPWRYETTWRDRANNLFNDWIVPWTIEEDRLLLELAVKMNRNWQKISEEFISFKNPKGCLTRYKILKKNLADPRFPTLEEYHEAYAMTRYNVFQYRHLKEILTLLLRCQNLKIDLNKDRFTGLSRDCEPPELMLKFMLLTYDRDIMKSTIESLQKYKESRDEYQKVWVKKHGERRKNVDRRTFHRCEPQSVASAIHIRGLQLIPKHEIKNLNDFEYEIYKYFNHFCRTKALKKDTARPYIPSASDLIKWAPISRIILTKLSEIDETEDMPSRKNWKTPSKNGEEGPNPPRNKRVYQKRNIPCTCPVPGEASGSDVIPGNKCLSHDCRNIVKEPPKKRERKQ